MKQLASGEGVIALADGTVFKGTAFGAERQVADAAIGEVVFNTSMYGYQEILTDPSYSGQVMCFTYPHIGNVGCNEEDDESSKVHVQGVIIRNLSPVVSNFRASMSFPEYLRRCGTLGISGIDTRELTTYIRDNGAQMGALASGDNINVDDLVDKARSAGTFEGKDLVSGVTCEHPYHWNELPWSLKDGGFTKIHASKLAHCPHVVAVDCGVKYNILRLLLNSGFRVTVVPASSTAEDILAHQPDALFLSNGPGDPEPLTYLVDTVKELLGKLPMFGICLGHQILGQALGAKTYKLKFGHRGGNHPVKDLETEKVEITVQNHGFAVDASSLSKSASVTHINLNDNTVAGLKAPEYKAFCIQYHPEASPGPHDAAYLFDRFYDMVTS